MTHQRFGDWLKDYQTERITDDMKLWNDLEFQMIPTRRKVVISRVGWLVAILILIMTTAGVYALDQILNHQTGDNGIDAVREQGKVAELFITQDFGGEYDLKFTLETIYADSNRIYVTMSASGTAPTNDSVNLALNARIFLDDGTELPYLGFGGESGLGGSDSSMTEHAPFTSSLIANFDSSLIETDADTIAFTIEVELLNVQNIQEEGDLLGAVEYSFDAIAFNKGTILTPNQIVTANTIEMHLQEVSIAPSLTRLEMCYTEPPAPEGARSRTQTIWLPIMSLSVNGEMVFDNQIININPNDYNPDTGCYTYNLPFALNNFIGEWTLSVDRFIYQLTPPIRALQVAFDEAGLPANAMPDGGYNVDTTGLDEAEATTVINATRAIYEEWQEKFEGAWTFTFTVPEA